MALFPFGCLSRTALVSEEALTCQHPASSAPTWLRQEEAMLHLPSPLSCRDFFWQWEPGWCPWSNASNSAQGRQDGAAWALAAPKSWGAVRPQTHVQIVLPFPTVFSNVVTPQPLNGETCTSSMTCDAGDLKLFWGKKSIYSKQVLQCQT